MGGRGTEHIEHAQMDMFDVFDMFDVSGWVGEVPNTSNMPICMPRWSFSMGDIGWERHQT